MRKLSAALLLSSMLVACQSGPVVYRDAHSGHTLYYGSFVNAYQGPMDWLKVRPFAAANGEYGFETTYSNYGWIFINEAWTNGKKLRYVNSSGTPTACGSAGGCVTLEEGVVFMSEVDFRQAATQGLSFGLRGQRGSVDGKIPAKAFSEALNLKAR